MQTPMRWWSSQEALWGAGIALAALALYARTVGFGWVYDDQMEVVRNIPIRSLANLPQILSTTVWAGSGMETYLYRPLVLISYALNYLVSGLAPWSFHLVNISLHAAISVLVFRIGRVWGLSLSAAGIAGLIFAVHPIHVEVIAAVFGRKDLLVGFFTLSFLLLHRTASTRGGWRLALPVLSFAAAVLSKEVGVVGLGLVAAQDWFLTEDRRQLLKEGRRAGLYVAYAAILLGYVLVRNAVTGGVGVPDTYYMDNPLVAVGPLVRIATGVMVVGKGLGLQLFPFGLSPDYSFDSIPIVESPLDWRFLATLLALGLGGWGLWRARQGFRKGNRAAQVLFLVVAWYGLTILPTANILVTIGSIFGERLLYLPSVAFCLAVGWGLSLVISSQKIRVPAEDQDPLAVVRWPALLATLAWGAVLTFQAVSYSRAWDNDITLFRHAVRAVPNSTKANHKLGEELLRVGEIGPALPYLRRAIEIAPDNEFAARTLEVARQEVARRYLPGNGLPAPLPVPDDDPEILFLLGKLSQERGDRDRAGAYWQLATQADSTHALSRANLGILRARQGDTATALVDLQAAVGLAPDLWTAWFELGRIHLAQGRTEAAYEALENVLLNPHGVSPGQLRWAQEAFSRFPRD